MLTRLLLIAAAGAAGTLARYLLQTWFHAWAGRATGLPFTWGTLLVNAVGCFLFGLVWALAEQAQSGRALISPETRLIILAGFLGAFTTFSTFGFETGELIRDNRLIAAGANLAAQNVLGIVLAIAGLKLGAWLLPGAMGG